MAGKVVRGTSYVFLSQVARTVAKGGLLVILTRYLLEPSEYGLLFLTMSVLGMLMLFANLGLTKSAGRYINDYRETSPELVPTVIRSTMLYNGLLLVVVCVALFFLHGTIASLVGEPGIAGMLLVGAAYLVTKSFQGNAMYFLHGFNRMGLMAIVTIVANVVTLLAVPGLVLLGHGLEGALWGYVLGYGAAAAVGLAIVYHRFYTHEDVSKSERREVSRKVLRYSAPLTLTMGANVVSTHADRVLLSVFRGPAVIAFYTLAKQITGFLIMPARSLGMGASPTFGEQKANDRKGQAARLYEQAFTYTVTLYAPIAAGLVLVADPTVRLLFGSDYAGAVPVLQIFSLYLFLRAIDTITNNALDYLGRARDRAISKGALTVVNVVLNLVLIPPFGVIGATVATVLTHAIYVGTELFIIADELPIDGTGLARSLAGVGAVTGGMCVVVYPLTDLISSLPSLVGVIGVGGSVWALLVVVSGVVDPRQLYTTLT